VTPDFFATGCRHISDPVLGSIPVFEECDNRLLDDLPLLQRLRRIKQLPVVPFVFPTADHSRFAHSLGAYYWAQHYGEALELTDRERRLVRWAALLHDIGHYPCSHTLEKVYQRIPGAPVARDEPTDTSDLWAEAAQDPLGFVCWAESGSSEWGDHETLTEYALQCDADLACIIDEVAPEFSVDDLISVMRRDPPPPTAHLRQVFHSQVDVDRMDYLVRDSQIAGATYGLVEPAHIIRRARIVPTSVPASKVGTPEEQMQRPLIAYDDRAVPRLDHFVLARYFYYSNVIYHKTVLGFDLLLRAICAGLVAGGEAGLPTDVESVRQLCEDGDFHHFTDDVVYRGAAEQASSGSGLTAEFSRMLLNRIHPTAVMELRATRQDKRLEREMTTLLHLLDRRDHVVALAERCNVDPRRVGWASWELSFENMYPFRSPIELQEAQPDSEDILDQIYVVRADSNDPCLLAEHDGSLVSAMRDRSIVGACVYYFSEESRPGEVEALRAELKRHLD
jgi:HD superfamily phosphohydrolase